MADETLDAARPVAWRPALAARGAGTAARCTGQTGPRPSFDDLPGPCPPPCGTHRPGMAERHEHDGATLRPTRLTTRVPSAPPGIRDTTSARRSP
jgi:hypothetical protein